MEKMVCGAFLGRGLCPSESGKSKCKVLPASNVCHVNICVLHKSLTNQYLCTDMQQIRHSMC